MMEWSKKDPSGFTLIELMITLTIIGILIAIAWPLLQYLIALIRLNIATWILSQHWKITRFDATGTGETPITLCMTDTNEGIKFAQISGDDCESMTSWRSLFKGVSIDTANSTLRTKSSVAGNGGNIYRVSWADTNAGLGGSWGQLGRIVVIADGITAKRCLFLFNTDGSWNIRKDEKCNKT